MDTVFFAFIVSDLPCAAIVLPHPFRERYSVGATS
jgi:hypothetical protein